MMRPRAVTAAPTLEMTLCPRDQSGPATHCIRCGGPTRVSRATALLPASCSQCVHSSISRGQGLTVFAHCPLDSTQATPSGVSTRSISALETEAPSPMTSKFTMFSA